MVTDDPFARLFERRVVMASGPLDSALVDTVAPRLLTLDADGEGPIELLLDCPDADLDSSFTLLDICDAITSPLVIVVAGRLTGPGIVLLTTRHRRLGRPHATLQLREPRLDQTQGDAEQVTRLVEQHRRRVETLIDRVSERTTRPKPLVADEMSRGIFLTSEQAVTYGLLDDVARRASSG